MWCLASSNGGLSFCQEPCMTCTSPHRAQQSYRHEAFLWHDASDFTASMVPFLEEGLEAGEPRMVAGFPRTPRGLGDALAVGRGGSGSADLAGLAGTPAGIFPPGR